MTLISLLSFDNSDLEELVEDLRCESNQETQTEHTATTHLDMLEYNNHP